MRAIIVVNKCVKLNHVCRPNSITYLVLALNVLITNRGMECCTPDKERTEQNVKSPKCSQIYFLSIRLFQTTAILL